jgi:hypothetical protein
MRRSCHHVRHPSIRLAAAADQKTTHTQADPRRPALGHVGEEKKHI